MDCFDIFKCLVKKNITIRHEDFINNNPAKIRNYHIITEKYQRLLMLLEEYNSIQHIIHDELFLDVFSKGIYRAELLYELLNGILHFSKSKINFHSVEQRHNTIASVIISSQIFGDGNHRTSLFYLITFAGLSQRKASDVIIHIENVRQNTFACPCPDENSKYHERYEKQILKMFV